ncbi:hypothetical protein BJY04DRAFT_128609 [Aspergillus karnatakaensis]|uniref:uncharacterized protein n=1 Tax=Aspergillus karnatakaensis TaxID=1810916 RepID=UPI003CCDA0BD
MTSDDSIKKTLKYVVWFSCQGLTILGVSVFCWCCRTNIYFTCHMIHHPAHLPHACYKATWDCTLR